MAWWYNLLTNKVEEDLAPPNSERLGPFETEDAAANALENARARNEKWGPGKRQCGTATTNSG